MAGLLIGPGAWRSDEARTREQDSGFGWRGWHVSGWGDEVAPRLLLVGAMLAYALYFGRLSIGSFEAFYHPGFDLGIYDQGIWLLSRLKTPFITIMGLNLFGDHVSYILFLLVPFYWVWPSAQVLLVLQTLALALAAVPVFLLSRKVLRSSWFALFPAVGFLLTPAVGWLNLENFHPDSFEVALFLFAIYFMSERRWRAYFTMVILLLAVKEDVPLVVFPLGVYVALTCDRRRGLMTSYLAALWFIVTVFFLQPVLSHVGPGKLDAFRIPFGGLGGLLSTLLHEPWQAIAYMLTAQKIKYLLQLLLPVLLLPMFSSFSLVVVLVVLVNLLSTFSYQFDIQYHYTSLLIAGIAAGAIFSLAKVAVINSRRTLAVGMCLAALLAAYTWGPFQWSRTPAILHDPQGAEAAALREAVSLIPDEAVVSARSRFTTHLTHREEIYDYPTPFYAVYWGDDSLRGKRLPAADRVEYVLERPDRIEGPAAEIWPTLANEGFVEIFSEEGIVLLKRLGSGTARGGPP